MVNIQANLNRYLYQRQDPSARYTSFDYCYNHFQSHRETGRVAELAGRELQTSCLQLGFYLASWGMFRGSAELLQHSARSFVPVIEAVVAVPSEVWDIDVGGYTLDAIEALFEVRGTLRNALPGGRSDTLVTKTMLGIFGCVPAFDSYFKRGFGVSSFSRHTLNLLKSFYDEHAEIIENHRVTTWDFEASHRTERRYTQAKVLDMIFFTEGSPARE